jgi:hypothetical protein
LICIPQESLGQPLSGFSISVRLKRIFELKRFKLLGDLHGIGFAEFLRFRNCGTKTLEELRGLVRSIQRGQVAVPGASIDATAPAPVQAGYFFISTKAHELNLRDLPLSARLEGVLAKKRVARLGDLNGISVQELRRLPNCGKKTIEELVRLVERAAAGEFDPATGPFSTSDIGDVLCRLDRLLAELPTRDRDILLLRLGAEGNRIGTLEEVGAKFKLTRERVRQIAERTLLWLQKQGGPKLAQQLRGIASVCDDSVSPLTPPLLAQWLGTVGTVSRLPFQSWVRLLSELHPGIPGWPQGQEPAVLLRGKLDTVAETLEAVLQEGQHRLPLKEAFDRIRKRPGMWNLSLGDFLETLKRAKTLIVDFPKPDQPEVRLRRLRLGHVVKAVLLASHVPLVLEDILARAEQGFGKDLVSWEPRALGNRLTPEMGFYLLGPRAYGLRQHFRLRVPDPVGRGLRSRNRG